MACSGRRLAVVGLLAALRIGRAETGGGAGSAAREQCRGALTGLGRKHGELELAAICRARMPISFCRLARQELGAQPWDPETVSGACSRWVAVEQPEQRDRVLSAAMKDLEGSAKEKAKTILQGEAVRMKTADAVVEDKRRREDDRRHLEDYRRHQEDDLRRHKEDMLSHLFEDLEDKFEQRAAPGARGVGSLPAAALAAAALMVAGSFASGALLVLRMWRMRVVAPEPYGELVHELHGQERITE